MSEHTSSFCWLRLLAKTRIPSTLLPQFNVAYEKTPGKLDHGGRPPPRIMSDGHINGAATYWGVDTLFAGDPKSATVFDLGPAFASEGAANKWIEGDEGQLWAGEAADYCLLGTWPQDAFKKLKDASTKLPSGDDKFPEDDWMETYRHMHEVIPIPALFEPDDFLLDPPPSNDDECVALGAKTSLKTRTVAQLAEVASQAHSTMHALQPVFDILGIDLSHPPAPAAAAAAVNLVQQNITRVVFHFKNTINRNRPWNTCKGRVDALWKKGDRLYPGHSSYPSGHATTAYTWAYYLGSHFPDQQQQLLAAASRVAENREVAGVHFRSDSDAGEKLGKWMAERLREAEAKKRIDLSVITKLSPVPRP